MSLDELLNLTHVLDFPHHHQKPDGTILVYWLRRDTSQRWWQAHTPDEFRRLVDAIIPF